MLKRITFVIVLMLWGSLVMAQTPTDLIVTSDPDRPSLLVNFNMPDIADVDHWHLYYSTPFDPDNWIMYKTKEYQKWEIINETGSPHQCTIHVAYCPLRYVGWATLAVTATDAAGNETLVEEGIATWSGGGGE